MGQGVVCHRCRTPLERATSIHPHPKGASCPLCLTQAPPKRGRLVAWFILVFAWCVLFDRAEALSREAFEAQPRQPFLASTRGAVLLALGDLRSARDLLESAAARVPSTWARAVNLAAVARCAAAQNDEARSLEAAALARRLAPGDPSVEWWLVEAELPPGQA